MKQKIISTWVPIFSLLLLFIIFIYQFFYYSPQNKLQNKKYDGYLELANTLLNKNLYKQAINEFENLITNYKLNTNRKANIIYKIAIIYQDNLSDYANALRYLYKLNILYPEFPLMDDVNKRIVACLERLNQSLDAKEELDRFTGINKSKPKYIDNSEVIAKIGDRKITYSEFLSYINNLPETIKSTIKDKKSKIELLKEYLITELLYESAKRADFEKSPDVQKALSEAKKAILVQKLLKEKIGNQLKNINPEEILLYYKANKDRYKDKNNNILPYDQVKDKVLNDYLKEKQNVIYNNYIQQLMRAENVEIYENKF